MRGDLKQITASGIRVTNSVQQIVDGIQQGRGLVGKLLTDNTLSAKVDDTVNNLDRASGKVNDIVSDLEQRKLVDKAQLTLENAQQISDKLNQAITPFLNNPNGGEQTIASLRDTVVNAKQARGNLADDSEALKHNFFLRGFFHRRGYFNLSQVTPAKYEASKFVKSGDAMREWLTGSELFTRGPDGSEALTAGGKVAVRQAMGRLVEFLPNRAVMVEGYSTSGTPAERYIHSRDRAELVRKYLENEFGLKAGTTGMMPLGDTPPEGSGMSVWDGVSLVLLE